MALESCLPKLFTKFLWSVLRFQQEPGGALGRLTGSEDDV